jgi:hypothetical protein
MLRKEDLTMDCDVRHTSARKLLKTLNRVFPLNVPGCRWVREIPHSALSHRDFPPAGQQ